ncbi:hypothetical protein D9M69_550070 [compost metagenome]
MIDCFNTSTQGTDSTNVASTGACWFAINENLPLIGRLRAGKDFDQCTFATTILTHQVIDLACFDNKADFFKRLNTTKGFLDVSNFKKGWR